jgi:hypothetical protein
MSARTLPQRIPSYVAPLVIALALVTLVYALLVRQELLLWLVAWGSLAATAAAVLLVYLFYRLVVAVEEIARKV